MKTEQKQHVKSYGIISLLMLIGAAALICVPVWSGRTGASQQRTLHRAESLAYQLLESRKGTPSRGPASIESSINHLTLDQGQIGMDLWDHPYQYRLLKGADNQPSKILVWSLGPNGKPETSDETIESNRDHTNPQFSGDDLGIMLTVK
jgi:type II secretory pathway pseudopilin PulG